MVVVAVSSVRDGRPTVVDLADDVASGENQASTSVMADDDGVFGYCFLHEGIVYGVIGVQLGLLRGKP
jgi:hypothetical protein